MNIRQRASVPVFMSLLLAGCILTDDRSGDRSESAENGFWRREGLAAYRVLTSPLPLVYGICETGEELGVGLVEMVCGCQFRSCAYPWEMPASAAVATPSAASVPEQAARSVPKNPLQKKNDAMDMQIRLACSQGDWRMAARLCRQRFSKNENRLQLIANGLQLAMVNWNADDRVGAIIAMDTVVSTCAGIGRECEAMAVGFRNEFRSGTLPKRFPSDEVTEMIGVRKAICDAAAKEAAAR